MQANFCLTIYRNAHTKAFRALNAVNSGLNVFFFLFTLWPLPSSVEIFTTLKISPKQNNTSVF